MRKNTSSTALRVPTSYRSCTPCRPFCSTSSKNARQGLAKAPRASSLSHRIPHTAPSASHSRLVAKAFLRISLVTPVLEGGGLESGFNAL